MPADFQPAEHQPDPLDAVPPDPGASALAEATSLLASTLSVEGMIQRLFEVLVPAHASWVMLGISETDGRWAVTRHSADSDAIAEALWEPPERSARTQRVLTGTHVPLPVLVEDDLPEVVPPAWQPEVRGLHGRPALLLPLQARGTVFGVLSLLGADPAGLPVLLDLVQPVALALDAARIHRERSHIATVLQRGLRPPTLPEIAGLRCGVFQRQADSHTNLGGDFYDLHGSGGDWSVALGDVAGKGVEAAVLTGKARQAMRTAALVDRSPSAILRLLNAVLLLEEGSTFVTVLCGRLRRLDGGRWRLDMAAAGHPPPLVLRADGEAFELGVRGTAVGAIPDRNYEEASIELEPGDVCLLFTDGVTEARDERGEMFGRAGIVAVLQRHGTAEPGALVEQVARAAMVHRSDQGRDDIAVLALRVGD